MTNLQILHYWSDINILRQQQKQTNGCLTETAKNLTLDIQPMKEIYMLSSLNAEIHLYGRQYVPN